MGRNKLHGSKRNNSERAEEMKEDLELEESQESKNATANLWSVVASRDGRYCRSDGSREQGSQKHIVRESVWGCEP